jgi:hypothetical protein
LCELSALHVGGEWQWLVRQEGRDVAEGAAPSADDARPWRSSCSIRPREFLENRPRGRVLPALRFKKTGLPVALLTASNISVLKSKNRLSERLPGFTAAVFDNYSK